ncbi:unnamed protein product [Brassica oleracea var. botrytis]
MFELWFREMEATTVVAGFSSGGVEAPSAPPTPVQVSGKGVFLRFAFAGLVTESSRFDDEALRRGEVGQLNN